MQITRKELYVLVCAEPLSKIAPRFGISGTDLAAICRDRDIPYPGSGYWTRKSFGLHVALKPLPASQNFDEATILIEPRKKRVARVVERSAEVATTDVSEPVLVTAPATASPRTAATKQRKANLHPIVAEWLAEHQRRRQEARHSRDPWSIRSAPAPWSEIDHRRHRFCDALFRALEARGARISQSEKSRIVATIDEEKIEFQVREKTRQVKMPEVNGRRPYPTQELVGTGRLVLSFHTYLRGSHNEQVNETETITLDDRLPKIVGRFFEGAQVLKDWHAEQELERERWRQEAEVRAERERVAKQEAKRRERLAELARDWQQANHIRDLVTALKSQPFDPAGLVHGKSLAEWFEWAETVLEHMDPTSDGPEGLFSTIGEVKAERGWS